jgi:hypothetical protein
MNRLAAQPWGSSGVGDEDTPKHTIPLHRNGAGELVSGEKQSAEEIRRRYP